MPNMCPTYISTLFEQPAIKYDLRNHDFTIPRFNTVSCGKHSLRYMGPRVWSSVPSNVKKASTLSSFKYNIRKVDLSMLLDDNNLTALTALFALLNLLFLIYLFIFFIRLWIHLYILYIVLSNFSLPYTVQSFSQFS